MSTERPQVTIPDTEIHGLRSSNVEQEFRIFVALGQAYANSDKAYPVLYVLDANAVFGTVTELFLKIALSAVVHLVVCSHFTCYSTNLILSGAISWAARRYGGTNQRFSTMNRCVSSAIV
jgi:predicted alpha/beta superfamily hydrolase